MLRRRICAYLEHNFIGVLNKIILQNNKIFIQGVIKNGCFTKDYSFSSISASASVILGRNANGRKEWVKLDGRSFEEVGK